MRSPGPAFRDRPGLLLAAVGFFVVTGIANAAKGDWVSLVLGILIAVVCAVRWSRLRPHHFSTDGLTTIDDSL